jgi:hypothetical protein
VNILNHLQNLGTSTHLEQALEAMTVLADHIIKGNNAQLVVEASGLATIVFAMYRYYETSERIVLYGLGILVDMTFRLGESERFESPNSNSPNNSKSSSTNVVGQILHRLSFLNKIPHLVTGGGGGTTTASTSSSTTTTTTTTLTADPIVLLSNRQIQSKAACLLNNLALYAATDSDPIMMDRLASEELVIFMRNVMLSYPDEVLLNEAVCQYLDLVTTTTTTSMDNANVSIIVIIKDRLLNLGVVPPLASVFHKFSNYDGGTANTAVDDNDDDDGSQSFSNYSVKECVERIVEYSKLVLDRLVVSS